MEQRTARRERGRDYLWILAGTCLMALSTNMFYEPAQMVPGGFTGLSIILSHITQGLIAGGLPIWVWNLVLNVPLILFSARLRGWRFVRRTLAASLAYSAWMLVLPERALTPEDLFLTAVAGGGLMGIGLGMVFLGKATTGGTDTLAALLQRALPHLNTARIMPVLDAVVILLSVWIFGLKISLYAVITVILCGWLADWMILGQRNAVMAWMISDRPEQIAEAVHTELDRGATLVSGSGTYTNLPRQILFCAVSQRQSALLRQIVSETDPDAFLILTDAREVRGEGFLAYTREEL